MFDMCDMYNRDLVRVDGLPLSLVLPSTARKCLEFGSKPNSCCCFDGHNVSAASAITNHLVMLVLHPECISFSIKH